MSSFSHLSATSHNSSNGNPKKHWRGPAWFDSAIWEAATPPRSCNPVIKRKEYQLSFPTPSAKDPASARPTSKELVASPVMANLQSVQNAITRIMVGNRGCLETLAGNEKAIPNITHVFRRSQNLHVNFDVYDWRRWALGRVRGTGSNIGRGGRRGRNVGERGATVPDFVPFQLPPRQTGACGVTGNGRLAHTCPTLRPGAARPLVLPCRGSGARGAPVRARSICEALGGNWGYPWG